jgi:hypothetical protein
MAQGIEWLSREKHPAPRMAAAALRADWLAAVSALANHPSRDRETVAWLQELLAGQLQRWPPDADAWLGERSQGLHTYELVRDGYLLSLLSFEDLQTYRVQVGIEKLGELVGRNIDADEGFYLRCLRKVINGCELPYPERQRLWEEIESERERLQNSDAYPFIADQVMGRDIAGAQRLQALDRARCVGWNLALAAACGQPPLGETLNPLTGAPIPVKSTGDQVVVGPLDPQDAKSLVVLRVAASAAGQTR